MLSPDSKPYDAKKKWDGIHSKADPSVVPDPCHVLKTYGHLMPQTGLALDLACGMGGNAMFLAQHGFKTTAIDISSVAIDAVQGRQHPLIDARCEFLSAASLEKAAFNIIVVSNYLDRGLCGAIADALVPDGLLFYQTFVQDKANQESGPKNPEYLLESNELLTLFQKLKVLVFSDQGSQGDIDRGFRNQSYLVAQ